MKFFLFILFSVFACSGLTGQQYFLEDFENGIGQFTSFDNDGDGLEWDANSVNANGVILTGAAISNSWTAAAGALTPDNLLISEGIDLTSGSTNMILEFKIGNVETTNNWWEEYYDVIITTSNDPSEIMGTTALFGEVLPEGGRMLSRSIDISSYAGSVIYVSFRHHNCSDENFLILDDVLIRDVLSDDLELQSLSVQNIFLEGDVTIAGKVVNQGYNSVNEFAIVWNDGNGDNSETFNQTIMPGESFDFTHNTPLSAIAGQDYSLSVCVSSIMDLNSMNDCLNRNLSCASQEGVRLPLMEVFTSSTCPPCFTLATTGFGGGGLEAYLEDAKANYQEDATLAAISYQVNWPDDGDHAYNDEVGARVMYYGVGGAPTLYVDANESGVPDDVINAAGVPAYLDIEANHVIVGNEISVDVNIDSYATFENASVFVAVLDNGYPAGSNAEGFTNGETNFHHVFRKMLPNANGIQMTLNSGSSVSLNEMYEFTEVANGYPAQGSFDTHIGSEREIVVFIQSESGEILNSVVSKLFVSSVNEIAGNEFKVFPNPSKGLISIDFNSALDLQFTLYSMSGQVLKTGYKNGNFSVDISEFQSGLYLLSISDLEGNVAVSKINLVK